MNCRLIAYALALAALVPAATAAGKSADNADLQAIRGDFSGDVSMSLGNAIMSVEEGSEMILTADEAVVSIFWTHSAIDPVNFSEVIYARGSRVERIAPAQLIISPTDPNGFAVAQLATATAELPALSVRALDESLRYQLRPSVRTRFSFDVTAPLGSLDLERVEAVTTDKATLFALEALISGDFRHHVGEKSTSYEGLVMRNTSFAQIELTGARIAVDGSSGHVVSDSLHLSGEGAAYFSGALGSVQSGAVTHSVTRHLSLQGEYTASAGSRVERGGTIPLDAARALPPTWSVQGDFVRIAVDGRLVQPATAVAVASGAALMWAFYALYSRIPGDAVLRHESRRRIMELVTTRPGFVQEDLQREMGLTWGTFNYHLGVLRRRFLVRRKRAGRRILLYPAHGAPLPSTLLAGRGQAGVLLDFLTERPGVAALEAADALGLGHQLVYHHLKTLRSLGLVEAEPGRPIRWRVATHCPTGGTTALAPRRSAEKAPMP